MTYEADVEAHMDGFDDGTLPGCEEAKHEIEMGLCHDARRQAIMLR